MKYSRTARGFHWITVVLVIVMMGVGVYMAGLPLSMEKIKIYNIHKSIGFCILILTVLRLFWRLQNPPPPLPEVVKVPAAPAVLVPAVAKTTDRLLFAVCECVKASPPG